MLLICSIIGGNAEEIWRGKITSLPIKCPSVTLRVTSPKYKEKKISTSDTYIYIFKTY